MFRLGARPAAAWPWRRGWSTPPAAGGLPGIARELAYLDAQGGRPQGFRGTRRDRNAVLYLPRL